MTDTRRRSRAPSFAGGLGVIRSLALGAALALAACGARPPAATDDAADDAFLDAQGKADAFGVAEGSDAALGVLRLVNEADGATLHDGAGISALAQNNLLQVRAGADGRLGTRDDREITTLAQLDAVPYVGPKTFRKLFAYAEVAGYIEAYLLHRPAPSRVVAIGDLHGDLAATRRALRLAGAVDDADAWIGGDLVVVQLGDVLDRGDDERAILELFDRLRGEAAAAGGALVQLLGNHEVMNVAGDFRYVTAAGFATFRDLPGLDLEDPWVVEYPVAQRPRAAAFLQGLPYARALARLNVVVIVGDTLFAHAGVRPEHVGYGLARLNYETRAWMLWDDLEIPAFLDAEDGPVWYRDYGDDATVDCETLGATLAQAAVARMVVGHTPQGGGITSACDERLWRVDVGLSAYYGGDTEVLELTASGAQPLR
jgi:hypothetical protein